MFEADFHKREDGFQSPKWGDCSKVSRAAFNIVSVPAMGLWKENIINLIIGTEMPISQ